MTILDRTEAQSALDALASVLAPSSAAYVCGPLDHGRLFYEAQASGGNAASVREQNQARLTAFVVRLRGASPSPVIDPGLLRIDGWDGRAYGEFFIEVIRRFVSEAWFIDGWEYSHGATKEFAFCVEHGIDRRDERGDSISAVAGAALIAAAADHIETLGVDGSKLRSRLDLLAELGD
jgi:hypothetical protein